MSAFARSTDPDTAHAAAFEMRGRVAAAEAIVFRAVAESGASGATLDDVIAATGLDKVTASPRFRPLEERGLLRRHGKRLGRAGRMQQVWIAGGAP